MTPGDLQKEALKEERQQAIEHRDVLLDTRAILETEAGKRFFKYLFKYFDVAQSAPLHLQGVELHRHLGLTDAGNAIFKLTAEANVSIAASLLAQNEKDRYAKLYEISQIGQS